ncbi:MAG: hypothetical protein SGILL_000217 [Bacillariaceae sp.]
MVLPTPQDRDKAVHEAQECIDAAIHEGFQLDGFNLLGVVANPRSGMIGSSSAAAATSSTHGTDGSASHSQPSSPSRTTQQSTTTSQGAPSESAAAATAAAAAAAVTAEESEPGMFSDAVHTIEYTLATVTEQIETLNLFLEELSRQYLGDDTGESLFLEYYYQDEEDATLFPDPQNLPPQLANLQIQDLQSYLEECGVLAHSLFAQGLTTRTLDHDIVSKDELDQQLQEIPEEFYHADFDLTNSLTFVELLLQQQQQLEAHPNGKDAETTNAALKPDETEGKKKKKKSKKNAANALYQPTQELVPVREQDSLAGHLDRVELALQDQVRQKSSAFFQETTRFRQLQASIEDLLQQVHSLRSTMQQAISVYGQTKDISNHQRQDYERLVDLLDASMELIRCKASIGGLLSANDYLGAAQQIQYGRKLLQGVDLSATDPASITSSTQPKTASGEGEIIEVLKLRQLKSLSTCDGQFTQYESLVVQNLSEEIVEVFFNWSPSEKERIQEMVQALQLCEALDKTAELYQRRLQQTVRMTVRTTIAEFVESSGAAGSGGVTSMTYAAFYSCLQLLIEEIQAILKVGSLVDEFCAAEQIFGSKHGQQNRWTEVAVSQGSDLATKSIAELLRLRKESHALISQSEMKQLWDTCLAFNETMEGYGNNARAVSLRSTLAAQAKAWLDRTHESNMSSLVAALDSERWSQCEAALTRLCTGLATVSAPVRSLEDGSEVVNQSGEKSPCAVVEGVQYKVVWSCLLLVEMTMTNLSAAAHFQSLAPNAVTKVVGLLREWNRRTTELVLGAGAINSAARLKSINAKHLSYVTQCLGMMMALLPHIYAALMAQLPTKQHALLSEIDNIKKEYQDHNDNVLNKFVSIIGGIVEHGLTPKIAGTDFAVCPVNDGVDIKCCAFLEGISNSTKKLHQVLNALLPPDHLQDVFSRIFAYLDEKIPALFIAATAPQNNGVQTFQLPSTDDGKKRMIMEVLQTTKTLNALDGVHPWDFTAMNVLERKLDYTLPQIETSLVVESVEPPENEENGPIEAGEERRDTNKKESPPETGNSVNENGEGPEDPTMTPGLGVAPQAENGNAVTEATFVDNANGENPAQPNISEPSKPVENGKGSLDAEKAEEPAEK